jgi:hypothetical protein
LTYFPHDLEPALGRGARFFSEEVFMVNNVKKVAVGIVGVAAASCHGELLLQENVFAEQNSGRCESRVLERLEFESASSELPQQLGVEEYNFMDDDWDLKIWGKKF